MITPTIDRPCAGPHPDLRPAECQTCWLFVYDASYRASWGGDGPALPSDPNVPSPGSLARARAATEVQPAIVKMPRPPLEAGRLRLGYCDSRDVWVWNVIGDDGKAVARGTQEDDEDAWREAAARREDLVNMGVLGPDWAVAVTTSGNVRREWAKLGWGGVKTRDTLERTLRSLAAAGFPKPHLFVDGPTDDDFAWTGLDVTHRRTPVLTWANWFLSLSELVARNPFADRYAVFQDDLVCCRNLRKYLDRRPWPGGYLNLYTFPENEGPPGWHEAAVIARDGDLTLQGGKGAVALVFDRPAALAMLGSPTALRKYLDPRPLYRCKRADGGVVTAMNRAGYRELVHSPSLVQHTGEVSSMANRPHALAASFPGEEFDAMTLVV